MKEVMAIIQLNKMEATKDALEVIGISSFTAYKASGRGKQKGLQIPHPTPLDERDERAGERLSLGAPSLSRGLSPLSPLGAGCLSPRL